MTLINEKHCRNNGFPHLGFPDFFNEFTKVVQGWGNPFLILQLKPRVFFTLLSMSRKFLLLRQITQDKGKLENTKNIWESLSHPPHRVLKSTSHKSFCNRVLTTQVIILGHRESKKSCLNFCRNRNFNINFGLFVKQILIFRESLYITAKVIRERAATFLSE